MEILSDDISWDVCTLIFRFSWKYHLLDVFPGQILIAIAFALLYLSRIEIEKQNTNEKIKQEETANYDKTHEEKHILFIVFFRRT